MYQCSGSTNTPPCTSLVELSQLLDRAALRAVGQVLPSRCALTKS